MRVTAGPGGDPAALFPCLILVDGAPARSNLIAARSRLPEGIDADFVVHEFFVLHAYRGGPTAERAANDGFEHGRGISFWRWVVGRYTSNRYSEAEVDHPWGRRIAFHFDNGV